MRISVICRRGERVPPRGFTLLEALVVLAILGLATALVAPAGLRTIASWERTTQAEAILGSLAALPDLARAEGAVRRVEAGRHLALADRTLPEGWTLELATPLVVNPNGACTGTQGRLIDGTGVSLDFALEAPFCRIRLTEP